MSRYFCHDHADVLTLETRMLDARPGAVVLEQSPFHPGGGGQLPDRGRLAWASGDVAITGFEVADGRVWHLLAEPVEPAGVVQASVDPAFRALQTALHTNAHVLNALVFQVFRGALITGAQLNDDGTAARTSISPTWTTTGCARWSRSSTTSSARTCRCACPTSPPTRSRASRA